MHAHKVILALIAILTWVVPVAAAPPDQEATKMGPEDLRIRFEIGLGANTCINSADGWCSRYPGPLDSQDTGGYGRVGATVFLPGPLSFLAGGLTLDIGGYSLQKRAAGDNSSVIFHLAGMIRSFIPVEEEGFEVTVGLGLGLGHWATTNSPSWTGLTIPISAGIGYTVYDGIVVGGDVTFMPRLGGDEPHNIQFGLYAAYTLETSLRPGAMKRTNPEP